MTTHFWNLQGAAENAELLTNLAAGLEDAKGLFLFFNKLGIQGSGLVSAAERTPIMAHMVSALAEITDLATAAKGNRCNCLQLEAFSQDVARAFDFHGGLLNAACLGRLVVLSRCCLACWQLRCRKKLGLHRQPWVCAWLVHLAQSLADTSPVFCRFAGAGKKLPYIDSHALDTLYDLLKRACDLLDTYGQPGMLSLQNE